MYISLSIEQHKIFIYLGSHHSIIEITISDVIFEVYNITTYMFIYVHPPNYKTSHTHIDV